MKTTPPSPGHRLSPGHRYKQAGWSVDSLTRANERLSELLDRPKSLRGVAQEASEPTETVNDPQEKSKSILEPTA
jgi:hypothetical protein